MGILDLFPEEERQRGPAVPMRHPAVAGAIAVAAPYVARAAPYVAQLLANPEVRKLALDAGSATLRILPQLLDTVARVKCACGDEHQEGRAMAARMVSREPWVAQRMSTGEPLVASLRAETATMWYLLAAHTYKSADLISLTVREALQNSVDAIHERTLKDSSYTKGTFSVTLRRQHSTLTIEDDGIGMCPRDWRPSVQGKAIAAAGKGDNPLPPRLDKFLTLGGTDKPEGGFGGFGAAKAVILGVSSTKRWVIETGWVKVESHGEGGLSVTELDEYRQGVRITLHDVSTESTTSLMGMYQDPVTRVEHLLGLSKLPNIQVLLNGREINYAYEDKRGRTLSHFEEMAWADRDADKVSAEVKRYKGKVDAGSGKVLILIRMKNRGSYLFQWAQQVYADKVDATFIVDLNIRVKPTDKAYPFAVNRMSFMSEHAESAVDNMVQAINAEDRSATPPEKGEFEDILPSSDDPDEVAAARKLDEQFSEALAEFSYEDLKAFEAEVKSYEAEAKYDFRQTKPTFDQTETAPHWTKVGEGTNPTPEEIEASAEATGPLAPVPESVFDRIMDAAKAGEISAALNELGTLSQDRPSWNAQDAISDLDKGYEPRSLDDLFDYIAKIDKSISSTGSGSTPGVVQAAAVQSIVDAIAAKHMDPTKVAEVKRKAREKINPFGNRAMIRIGREFSKIEARKFKRNAKKYGPLLIAWDTTLRLLARAARLNLPFQTGFILENGTRGMAAPVKSGVDMQVFVLIHPLLFDDFRKLHDNNPEQMAIYLWSLGSHELAHVPRLERDSMCGGHNTQWAIAREDLGLASATLLPRIEEIVRRAFKIKGKKRSWRKHVPVEVVKELQTLRGQRGAYQKWMDAANGRLHTLLSNLDDMARGSEFSAWLRRSGEVELARAIEDRDITHNIVYGQTPTASAQLVPVPGRIGRGDAAQTRLGRGLRAAADSLWVPVVGPMYAIPRGVLAAVRPEPEPEPVGVTHHAMHTRIPGVYRFWVMGINGKAEHTEERNLGPVSEETVLRHAADVATGHRHGKQVRIVGSGLDLSVKIVPGGVSKFIGGEAAGQIYKWMLDNDEKPIY